MPQFDHEKLTVYQESIRFVAWADDLLESIPKSLATHNQLDRASTSVPLKVIKGHTRDTPLVKKTLHMVFSTKDRRPFIDTEIRPRLHAYMAEILRDIEPPQSQAYRVGGVSDHLHIAATLPRTVTIAKLKE